MRKNLLICDGCGTEVPGKLFSLKLCLAHRHSDIYDFCSYYCLGLWLYRSAYIRSIEEGIRDKGVSSR